MSETASSMDSQLPETSNALIPLPKPTKKRRWELTNAQREFFFHDPSRNPSQKKFIQWFENEHYHTLTQGQVSKILSPQSDTDPDGPEVTLPEPISIPQALSAVSTLRTFAEQQKEDHTIFLRQLRVLEREMKALQVVNSTQTTLERFFVPR
jgi:hypothetical protein